MVTKKNKIEKNYDETFSKGIKWFLIILALFAIVYFLTPVVVKKFTTVEYGNITFTKTKFADIPVYYYWYNLDGKNGEINRYNLYLRENPLESQVIVTGTIDYPDMGKNIYASINESSFKHCQNANRELTTLGMFIVGNEYNFGLAYLDNETANANGGKYYTCENKPANMIIEIEMTNRTIIERINEKCYRLEFDSCDNFLDVIEKFEVESVVDAKNRYLAK